MSTPHIEKVGSAPAKPEPSGRRPRQGLAVEVCAKERQQFERDLLRIEMKLANKKVRNTYERIAGRLQERGPPSPIATIRRQLERLIWEYGEHPERRSRKREYVLRKLAAIQAQYLRWTDDTAYLDFLRKIAIESPSKDERVAVVCSLYGFSQPPVVEVLLDLSASPHAEVRHRVAHNLAWVEGQDAPKARRKLIELLNDRSPPVRWESALLLGMVIRDTATTQVLLNRLSAEEHPIVIESIGRAVMSLEPERGRELIAESLRATALQTPWIVLLMESRRQR